MKKTKLFLLIAIVVMILSYSFTALSSGETLQHYGHSRVGYTSQESVSQRTDTLLLNQHWRSSANMAVSYLPLILPVLLLALQKSLLTKAAL